MGFGFQPNRQMIKKASDIQNKAYRIGRCLEGVILTTVGFITQCRKVSISVLPRKVTTSRACCKKGTESKGRHQPIQNMMLI